jgi:hypothetical protein
MASEQDYSEIQKRVGDLEEENARLRKIVKPDAANEVRVTEGEYRGHATLALVAPLR